MLSALIFLLLKIFLTEWVIRYSGHLSCRCSYDSNRENVDSVKSLYDNHSHYREHLSHCSNTENSPGRVLDRSCGPPPAPWQAQLFQIIPGRDCFNLRSTHVQAHNLHLPWQAAVALSYPKPVLLAWIFHVAPLRLFLLILWSCSTVLQMLKLLSYSPQLSLVWAASVLSDSCAGPWTLEFYSCCFCPGFCQTETNILEANKAEHIFHRSPLCILLWSYIITAAQHDWLRLCASTRSCAPQSFY